MVASQVKSAFGFYYIIATATSGHSPPQLRENEAQNATSSYLRISLTIPFYIGRLPAYNWSAVSILLVSLLLGKADCR